MIGHMRFLAPASLLVTQPAIAGDHVPKVERDRQLSEIVFQNYPPRALAAGEEGPVFFTVTLDKDARPTTCEVTRGSGHPLLDAETCDLIVQYAVFNSARDANGHLVRESAEGVVNWAVPGHAPAPINLSPAATKVASEKQVCRKNVRIGTLSGVERICMTPTEWARQADEVKQTYEQLQGRKGFSNEDIGKCMGSNCDQLSKSPK